MREFITDDPVAAVIGDARDLIAGTTGELHIALTGGRAGGAITAAIADAVRDRPGTHLWFSDERFLAPGDTGRNDSALPADVGRAVVHAIPYCEGDIAAAVTAHSADLHRATTARFCADNTLMDLTILSVGPDGHVASLFPHSAQLDSAAGVVAVTDSPKPPPLRISWTYPTINASRRVWLIAAGHEKADALAALRGGSHPSGCPAAGVSGKHETRLYTDVPPGPGS